MTMWRFNPPRARPGEPILADHANAILEVRDACAIAVASPLVRGPDGAISLPDDGPLWVKVTGGGASGKYAGTEQVPIASGAWSNAARTWDTTVDPLIEVNGSTSVPVDGSVRVLAFRGRAGWYFQFGSCS